MTDWPHTLQLATASLSPGAVAPERPRTVLEQSAPPPTSQTQTAAIQELAAQAVANGPREVADAGSRPALQTGTAFDLALANQALYAARQRYALRRGDLDTPAYRSAWLAFSKKIRSLDDLKVAQAKAGKRRSGETNGQAHRIGGDRDPGGNLA